MERAGLLEQLRRDIGDCQKCSLYKGRNNLVFGDGNPEAFLMLVGEGPGGQEDIKGLPFVGAAGQLLNRILEASGIKRQDIYIANVVKCRPPGNRLPNAEEVNACKEFLLRQISIIDPRIIVCLGSLAAKTLVSPQARITRIRGQWYERDGRMIMPTFHPAALLRDPSKKRPVWEDFKQIKEHYQEFACSQLSWDF